MTSGDTTPATIDVPGASGAVRVVCGVLAFVLFTVAVVGFGFGLFTWIGGGSVMLIVYDLVSSVATFGLGYLLLLVAADRRRLLG